MHATTFIAVLIRLLALTVLIVPLAAEAQQRSRVPRIGVLGDHAPGHAFLAVFRQGLRELGYTEGQDIVIEYRYAHGVADRFPDLAAELIRLKVDVLVVGRTTAARAAKAQTTTVPIVFALAGDPVGTGLVASLAHPGGNVTGISVFHPELSATPLDSMPTRSSPGYVAVGGTREEALRLIREAVSFHIEGVRRDWRHVNAKLQADEVIQ